MKEIKAVIQPFRLDEVLMALCAIPGLPGIVVSDCRAVDIESDGRYLDIRKSRVEIVVEDKDVAEVVRAIHLAARTGQAGDGRIWVTNLDSTVLIRSDAGAEGG